MQIKKGYSRIVLLIGKYAIKIPYNLAGVKHNRREKMIWHILPDFQRKYFCPVITGCRFLVIMERGKEVETPKIKALQSVFTSDLGATNYVRLTSGRVVLCDYGEKSKLII